MLRCSPLQDFIFYTWTYNLTYYGPEISASDRVASLLVPFQLLATTQCFLLVLWLGGAAVVHRRLVQRQPTPEEAASSPVTVYILVWTLAALAGAASSGRGFAHYFIQMMPALSLGAGLACARVGRMSLSSGTHWMLRLLATVAIGGVLYQLGTNSLGARHRTREGADVGVY